MTQTEKEQFNKQAKELLEYKRQRITEEMQVIPSRLAQIKELRDDSVGSELTYQTLAAGARKKFDELQGLFPSPYFNRLKLQFTDEKTTREIFIGKFSFAEENIYSWTSPLAVIRFDSPGNFLFTVDGKNQTGQIYDKDQYLIVDGNIKFLATERLGQERELIYQEYFSQHKIEFVLPEIVAQMEKAQDEVIRAQVRGPLVISGPAGSGKTTLALHRVAYLLQSPDTASSYSQDRIIVFVQDASTKKYFSGLLPSFGINDVEITTFGDWALDILNLSKHRYINQYLTIINLSNEYEVAKTQALKSGQLPGISETDAYKGLADIYNQYFTAEQKKFFSQQKQEAVLDRFDLTLLLMAAQKNYPLQISREYYQVKAGRELSRKTKREAPDYSLVVVDEFENYLPEQINLLKSALNKKAASILYVGDIRQQIYLGAINNWQDLGAEFATYDPKDLSVHPNIIRLQKVYRNTKEILKYISQQGYSIEVPEQLRAGQVVEELNLANKEDEIKWAIEKIKSLPEVSIGILGHEKEYLKAYTNELKDYKNVRVMPIPEAQGVEFDVVFLLGIDQRVLKNKPAVLPDDELGKEFWRISRDLLYIAMTRAMNELYVSIR